MNTTKTSKTLAGLFRIPIILVLIAGTAAMTGCSPIAITALGIGGTAGATHAMNGVTYRTFTAPMAKVRLAALKALNHMKIKVEQKDSDLIRAAASDRDIEIALETVSQNTTRMRTVAKKNTFLYDSATSTEITAQTERLLKTQQRVALLQ